MKDKIILSWSGGKDSAFSLYKIMNENELECVGLLTTFTKEYDRVTMHGVRRSLIEKQASLLNIPLDIVYIPKNCSMEEYGTIMRNVLRKYKEKGIKGFVFGDIFLEDVRSYREKMLFYEGFKGYFPLWGEDTRELVLQFIRLGFKAIITCVDEEVLSSSCVGRELNENFLKEIPPNIDPAGENGEYHCFVYDGPLFSEPINIKIGEIVKQNVQGKTFYYCDIFLEDEYYSY
ncbi:MAG: diphthine--ammonia ligase [Nitrososphaerota archaeon]